ncbi:hypothetical protein MNBD_GAMMA26-2538 [hydrothermal vent metagenome]|uniref:RDD domain-containing protein n=1 Tax=hydrothermal vent metagenome TaxID=652676 RepID=A0A3B1BB02_9ZZZZ
MSNPYQSPEADLAAGLPQQEYVGFWIRVGASVVDSIIMLMIIAPLLYYIYGMEYFLGDHIIAGPADFLLNYIFPAIAVIVFWIYKSSTPGKMAFKAIIVDAQTGLKPSSKQLIGRYFAYYVSLIPIGLGFFWIIWDSRKQGWHDKLAGTVVVYRPISV